MAESYPFPRKRSLLQSSHQSSSGTDNSVIRSKGRGEINNLNSQHGGRRRRHSNRNKNCQRIQSEHENETAYQNVSFEERPSSGRPGSPHRFFENSYDVSFTCGGYDVDCGSPKTPTYMEESHVTEGGNDQKIMETDWGNQVVHRHLNGLCVVTAGNVLKKAMEKMASSPSKVDAQGMIQIYSIQYLVNLKKDALSARGKLRTKNKRVRNIRRGCDENASSNAVGNNTDTWNNAEEQDGTVLPHDPMCHITFTNGKKIQLYCGVSGTIIELNHRLENANSMQPIIEKKGVDAEEKYVEGKPSHLLLTDPLLDGYLAIIMPRGTFPPLK